MDEKVDRFMGECPWGMAAVATVVTLVVEGIGVVTVVAMVEATETAAMEVAIAVVTEVVMAAATEVVTARRHPSQQSMSVSLLTYSALVPRPVQTGAGPEIVHREGWTTKLRRRRKFFSRFWFQTPI